MATLASACGVLAVIVFLIGLCMTLGAHFDPEHRKTYPRGFKKAVAAMEFAEKPDDVKQIVGEPEDCDRSQMYSQQIMDFLFIASYWLLLSAMSVLLAKRSIPFAFLFAGLALVCATLGAVFDIRENCAILRVLALKSPTEAGVVAIVHAAVRKWALVFAAVGLLSLIFLGRPDWPTGLGKLFALVGLAFAVVAVAGLVATLERSPRVEHAAFALVATALGMGVLFLFYSAEFVTGL